MSNHLLSSALLIVTTTMVSFAQSPMGFEGVRNGLEVSPEDYVAGVFEKVGHVQCEARTQTKQRCWYRVLVVDEMASRPISEAPRIHLKVVTVGEPGQQARGRFIGFLIPVGVGTDLYGGTFMSPYSEKNHRRFGHFIESTITGDRYSRRAVKPSTAS